MLKIGITCHTRDLWKLAWFCKQLCLLCPSGPWNWPGTALLSGLQSSPGSSHTSIPTYIHIYMHAQIHYLMRNIQTTNLHCCTILRLNKSTRGSKHYESDLVDPCISEKKDCPSKLPIYEPFPSITWHSVDSHTFIMLRWFLYHGEMAAILETEFTHVFCWTQISVFWLFYP